MIGSIISKFFGNKSDKDIKRLTPKIAEINEEYNKLSSLTDEEIIQKYHSIKIELNAEINSTKEILINKNESPDLIDQKLIDLETEYLNKNLNIVYAIVKDVARRLCGQKIIVMNQKMDKSSLNYYIYKFFDIFQIRF